MQDKIQILGMELNSKANLIQLSLNSALAGGDTKLDRKSRRDVGIFRAVNRTRAIFGYSQELIVEEL
jgi:hypothetical protein